MIIWVHLKVKAEVEEWRNETELITVQMCLKAKEEIEIESAVRLFTDITSSLSWCLHKQLQSLSEIDAGF